ncbi:MAG: L-threonine 3-dehydrogenase [Candidatus Abyssobacteria bacterium SURF_17]|uniref:L-threonine 3-dehydrogenase n=1 Tax=Candidatus Abyssobacteria bacterium SURF_17 TaxID=2093361 RepID=A0A419ES52_9BACT|nr:MAG: L-threonine 3-dehydrogenase [Candidatus Abyssubacteria bacterium SURF_17]
MKKSMLAAVFEGNGVLRLRKRPVPVIERGRDVLLRIDVASVCGTDVHILSVPPGHPANENTILGHEYVGTVLDAGDGVTHVKKGDRVVVNPNITCGHCTYCRKSLPNMCENMTTLGIFIDGGFAEYNVAPADAVFRISSDVPLEEAIFAEPLSCVMNAIQKLRPLAGESALVLGAGPIGLYFIGMFRMTGLGCIIVSEPNRKRAAMARKFGATEVIHPGKSGVQELVRARTGIGADIAVDAVGMLMAEAVASVRRGGRVLLFGMNSKAVAEIHQNDITRNEIQIIGSFIANATFPQTVSLLEGGKLNLKRLVTHRFNLEQIHAAIDVMRSGEAIKVLVKMGSDLEI